MTAKSAGFGNLGLLLCSPVTRYCTPSCAHRMRYTYGTSLVGMVGYPGGI